MINMKKTPNLFSITTTISLKTVSCIIVSMSIDMIRKVMLKNEIGTYLLSPLLF